MDQGWAAVISAAVGLVGALGGALAGGYAAIRGAREGAERAARAALDQTARQARDQYEHWLRQERRAAYAEMLKEADEHEMKLAELVSLVENSGERVSLLHALEQAQSSNIRIIRGIGPVMTIAGRRVRDRYKAYVDSCRQMSMYLLGREPSEISSTEVRQLYRSVIQLGSVLTMAVAADIQAGPDTTTGERDS